MRVRLALAALVLSWVPASAGTTAWGPAFLSAVAPWAKAEVGPIAAQEKEKTVWDGVYTAAQASRGAAKFETQCVTCHGPDGSDGNAPSVKGERFERRWGGGDVKTLFNIVRTTMPRTAAGSLTDAEYTDLVAYILKLNVFPDGAEELPVGVPRSIPITEKDAAGPLADFSLVQMTGCLTRGAANAWMLASATAPARTREPAANAAAPGDETKPLGSLTFRLLQVYPAADAAGQKIEVKGFLITKPDNRLTVTSLRTLAPRCDPAP